MRPLTLQSSRLVISALVIFASSLIAVSGQEVTPANEPNVIARTDDAPPSPLVAPLDPSAGEKRKQGLDLGLVLSSAYDNNIFLSSRNAQSDVVTRVSPTIGYVKGDKDSAEGGYLRLAYQPTAVVYSKNSDDDRIDHQASVAVGIRGRKMALEYSAAYSKLGDATADTGQQTDRNAFEHIVRVAWIPHEKLALEVAAGQSITDYADKILLDSREAFGEIALKYAYSPKTRVGLAYRAGRFEVDGSDDQTYHRVTAGIEWQPREKLRVELNAGAENRKVANGSSVTPVMEGRISWTPSEKTNFYLTAYRRETASAFSPGQNYRLTGVTAGVAQKIGDKLTARLEAGRERASYVQTEGTGGDAGRDDLWYIKPSLEYRLTEELGLEIFYRVSSNDSTRAGFGYDQQSAGISLQYKF